MIPYIKDRYLFPWTLSSLGEQDFFCYSVPISEILEYTAPDPFKLLPDRKIVEIK
jgi:hypothetical protein